MSILHSHTHNQPRSQKPSSMPQNLQVEKKRILHPDTPAHSGEPPVHGHLQEYDQSEESPSILWAHTIVPKPVHVTSSSNQKSDLMTSHHPVTAPHKAEWRFIDTNSVSASSMAHGTCCAQTTPQFFSGQSYPNPGLACAQRS